MQAERNASPRGSKTYIADRVSNRLHDTAVDLGAAGFDTVCGYGRADALAAIKSLGFLTGDTFTVDSTGDGGDAYTSDAMGLDCAGDCILRAAIEQANASGDGIIEFNILGTAPHTIQSASALPALTAPVVIDGTTLQSAGSVVRGLAINRFTGTGITVNTYGAVTISGNLIRTGTAGTNDHGNGGAGVSVATSDNRAGTTSSLATAPTASASPAPAPPTTT